MAVSSYGSGTKSSGVVRILKDLDTDIIGRHVLIVEDIIDTGLTLSWLVSNLTSRDPACVEICTLLRKPEALKMPVDVKYVGFDIPNEFVVGYGLDYGEQYRNLRDIGTLARTSTAPERRRDALDRRAQPARLLIVGGTGTVVSSVVRDGPTVEEEACEANPSWAPALDRRRRDRRARRHAVPGAQRRRRRDQQPRR